MKRNGTINEGGLIFFEMLSTQREVIPVSIVLMISNALPVIFNYS
jgi:hypothetical protein